MQVHCGNCFSQLSCLFGDKVIKVVEKVVHSVWFGIFYEGSHDIF